MLKIIIIAILLMLSPKQENCLFTSTRDINLASGSIRSGKTYAFNLRFIEDLENDCIPNVDCLISGKKMTAAYRNVIKPMMQVISENGLSDRFDFKHNPDRLIYKPKNIDCYLEGANDVGSEERIRGMTIQRWYGDEVTTYPKNFVLQAIGRCSAGNRYKYLTCNPDSPLHYIKTDFIDPIEKGDVDGKVWYFDIEHDNPVLERAYIDQLKRLYTGVFYDRFIKGLWVLAEGVIYNNFNRSSHLVETFPKEQIVEYVVGIDWGYKNPMAIVLMGVTADDQYYIIDEFYETGQLIDDSLISKLTEWQQYKVSTGYGDPARPEYIIQMQTICEKIWPDFQMVSAQNDVIEGIQEVQKHFIKRANNEYGLYICKHCINTIKEIENYRWKERKSGLNKDEPLKENDHAVDGLRYGIYTRRSVLDFSNSGTIEGSGVEGDTKSVLQKMKERRV